MSSNKSNGLLSYMPMTLLLLLLIFLYSIFMAALIPQIMNLGSLATVSEYYSGANIVNITVVNVFVVLFLVSFLQATFTQPGAVPSIRPWDPSAPAQSETDSDMSKEFMERGLSGSRGIEKKIDGRARFCRRCGKFKPDRTHHSNSMGACVLEMDHYCPWIRNCVGYYNKKYFFLLIFYGSITSIAYCIALGPRFVYSLRNTNHGMEVLVILCWLIAVLTGIVVTCFTLFHMWLMSLNLTTIEYCEKRLDSQKRTNSGGVAVSKLYEKSPYDIGFYRNICHTLGPWYFWLIPIRSEMSNSIAAGCVFEISESHPYFKHTSPPQSRESLKKSSSCTSLNADPSDDCSANLIEK